MRADGIAAKGLVAGYGGRPVIHGIDLHVETGEVVTLLGPNGAGKTTILLALAGRIPSQGTVHLLGQEAAGPLHRRARNGLAFLPEQRGVIRDLTVSENLKLAGCDPEAAFELSHELEPLKNRKVALLSGGEQQILATTRAMAARPAILAADELSLGLAPIVVSRMFALARTAADRGAAVLLVEQFARQVLHIADRAYVLQRGRIVLDGSAEEMSARIDEIEHAYLGAPDAEERQA